MPLSSSRGSKQGARERPPWLKVEWACQDIMSFFSQHYILLMQFTTDAVQTVQSVELVRAELVNDSSKQWSLIKIQNLWVKLFWAHVNQHHSNMLLEMMGENTYISSTSVHPDIFMRQDAIIWQFYSHGFASSYGFVEDFRRAATV